MLGAVWKWQKGGKSFCLDLSMTSICQEKKDDHWPCKTWIWLPVTLEMAAKMLIAGCLLKCSHFLVSWTLLCCWTLPTLPNLSWNFFIYYNFWQPFYFFTFFIESLFRLNKKHFQKLVLIVFGWGKKPFRLNKKHFQELMLIVFGWENHDALHLQSSNQRTATLLVF